MKLLIVYATTEGQTKKICEFLRDKAKKADHEVSLANALEHPSQPKEFDAVAVGDSLHAEKYQVAVEKYVDENHKELNKKPGVFISVSLSAASDEPESLEELKKITREFLDKTGWNPTFIEQVAGALRYSKYNFFKKFIMRINSV
ncbi:flavodoxin domain-containing protein [Fodinibius halophilus]|uniref:Protoporphyrinogen oxidase n=1 Tax=Fodinibius halophilus TaxID=1736908 RepID=A0A6M1T6Z7_9BACT|nr:flavodoxin domain-containing protein [Fodinibius halophilus]NGP89879.1 protoporphyrinogen oxidase [Fodinibius halophilus]